MRCAREHATYNSTQLSSSLLAARWLRASLAAAATGPARAASLPYEFGTLERPSRLQRIPPVASIGNISISGSVLHDITWVAKRAAWRDSTLP